VTKSFPGEAGAQAREIEALQCVVVGLLASLSVALLFVLRAADDNRLVSWQWVFGASDLPVVMAIVALALLAAYGASRVVWNGPLAVALVAACGALASLPFWSVPEVIVDAARYFVQAKHLALYGVGHFLSEWGGAIPAWTDLPLVPFFYGLLFRMAGETRAAAQVFNTLLFAATLALTCGIGKALWDRSTGCVAAVLLLGMPYLFTQVPLLLTDVPSMFFVTLAAFATLAAVQRGGAWRLGAAVAALVLALLSKYSAWIAFAFPLAFALSCGAGSRRDAARRAGAITLGAALVAAGFLLWKADVIAEQIALLGGYQVPALGRWQESAVSTFLFQIHPFVTLAAAGSVALAIAKRDARLAAIAAIALLALLLGGRRIRYLVIVMPLLALMAAYGLRALRDARMRQFIASCAAASAIAVALSGYLPFLRGSSAANLVKAGPLLDALAGDTVEVIVLPSAASAVNPAVAVPLLDLSTHKRLVYRRDLSPSAPPGREARETSPLRFTWEMPDAPFFLGAPAGRAPVVLVTGAADQALPGAAATRLAGYVEAGRLLRSDGVFRFQTLVRIYRPA